jgi:hypothetical protein
VPVDYEKLHARGLLALIGISGAKATNSVSSVPSMV